MNPWEVEQLEKEVADILKKTTRKGRLIVAAAGLLLLLGVIEIFNFIDLITHFATSLIKK